MRSVASEVALAVALVIGAGLLLRTVLNLSRVDAGFNRAQLVTFGVSLPPASYAKPEQITAFHQRLLDALRGTAGVKAVTLMSGLPPSRQLNANDTDIDGYTARRAARSRTWTTTRRFRPATSKRWGSR